jgi:hypothetical protein
MFGRLDGGKCKGRPRHSGESRTALVSLCVAGQRSFTMVAAFAEFSVISTSCMREPLLGSPPLAPKPHRWTAHRDGRRQARRQPGPPHQRRELDTDSPKHWVCPWPASTPLMGAGRVNPTGSRTRCALQVRGRGDGATPRARPRDRSRDLRSGPARGSTARTRTSTAWPGNTSDLSVHSDVHVAAVVQELNTVHARDLATRTPQDRFRAETRAAHPEQHSPRRPP